MNTDAILGGLSVFILIGAIIFLIVLFYFVPVRLWITAIFSGVRLRLFRDLVGMRLRNVPPALIVLGFWIVLQLINGYITYSATVMGRPEAGGVAWFAHVGGFLAGIALLFLLKPRRKARL